MSSDINGNFRYGVPDGNLAAEFRLVTRLAREIIEENSNDPFTCKLRTIHYAEAWIECLDIGTASTLNAASSLNRLIPSLSIAEVVRNLSLSASNTTAVSNQSRPFGSTYSCDGQTHGDGTINAFDIVTCTA